jgi:hypothetical protein
LSWSDLEASNTYIQITPASGNTENIRLFGAWYELEYLEQPDNYEGAGVKDGADVSDFSAANAHVINEEPISSTSVVEGVDITDLVAKDWSWFNDREVRVDYNLVNSDDGVTGYILHVWFEIEFAPFEEIISDNVTCDAQGIETDGDATGDLIENPADVIEHIITDYLGLDKDTYIDSDSFAAARQSLETAGARFAFAILGRSSASELLRSLAEQARSRLRLDAGKFRIAYRPDSLGPPAREIVSSDTLVGSARIRRMGLGGVFNNVIGYHSRDYQRRGAAPDKYAGLVMSEDSQSKAAYAWRGREMELFAVRDASYARDLIDFMVARHAEPARRYAWRSFLSDVDLERGDVVEISDLDLDLLKVKGEIVNCSFVAGSEGKRAVDSIALEAELESLSMYWSVPGGTYIRLAGGAYYFVVRRELVARLSSEGTLYIKGFVIGDQALPAAAANPLSYDSSREAIAFALSDNTRVMELTGQGNVLLPIQEETDQNLPFSGGENAIGSGPNSVYFNVSGARAAMVSAAGLLRLQKYVVENCDWELLHG